jgi:hypothetical protein
LKAHAAPHAPQLAASTAISVSQPVWGSPSQSAVPSGQAHTPWLQTAPAAQAMPHPPQFSELSAAFVSQPLTMLLSQFKNGSAQLVVHVP